MNKFEKYLHLVRNLLELLKSEMSKDEWENVKKILKNKKKFTHCKKCGKLLKIHKKNIYVCEECKTIYKLREENNE